MATFARSLPNGGRYFGQFKAFRVTNWHPAGVFIAYVAILFAVICNYYRNEMTRQLISSGSTFEAHIGYSRAVVAGDWVFVSGVIPPFLAPLLSRGLVN